MNERYWKIYGKALLGVNEDGGDVLDPIKFAELIIRECAEVANAHDCNHSGNDGAILNYFGVK
jgi:hypothetical protein